MAFDYLDRQYDLPTGIGVSMHHCSVCGKDWKCALQEEGKSCSSTLDGGRCPLCNWQRLMKNVTEVRS